MRELLLRLCEKNVVSGFEERILEYIAELVLPHVDSAYFDRVGNLVCFKKGKNVPKKKIVLRRTPTRLVLS